MLRTFGRSLGKAVHATASTGGAVFLANELYEYHQFHQMQKQMIPSSSGTRPSLIKATTKEWLLIGRQSPGYVRDPDKYPKGHLLEKIMDSQIALTQLGTSLDNESHYELFPDSYFQVQRCTEKGSEPRIVVKPEYMIGIDIHDLPENELYEIGFARKQGFANLTYLSPFFHSSIALRKVPSDHPPIDTVVLSGQEVKRILAKTDQDICHAQSCNLFQSNCYSASTFAMMSAIKEIAKRPQTPENNRDIKRMSHVLADAMGDNFSRGVVNNSKVMRQLSDIRVIQEQRGLLGYPAEKPEQHAVDTSQFKF